MGASHGLYMLTFLTIALFAPVVTGQKMCGIALGTGHDEYRYYSGNTRRVLWDMRAHKADYVHITAYVRQVGTGATTVRPFTNIAALTYVIRLARRNGFGIYFKPVVDLVNFKGRFTWRGRIAGTRAWFDRAYIPFIIKMAQLAQREKVDVFCIGSEYRASENKTSSWLRVIAAVRAVYKGKLTYIANHDSYETVKFWKQLDFISVSVYFRFVKSPIGKPPNLAQTRALFDKRFDKLNRWRMRSGYGNKKVLVGEVGFQSKGGMVNFFNPWAWTAKAKTDKIMQAQMYEAFLGSLLRRPWALGAMIWHYELNPGAGIYFSQKGYTPQNKPAEKILQRYYQRFCRSV